MLIDDHDLLAPVADVLEERPLAFGERPVRGRHEEHEVGLRDELVGEALVLAKDRVGARRVDDVEIAQERRRGGDDVHRFLLDVPAGRLAVSQNLQPRGGRRRPLLEHARARQRVDERALAGVELADDDEQKQAIELRDRPRERCLGGWITVEPARARVCSLPSHSRSELTRCFVRSGVVVRTSQALLCKE